MKTLESLCPSHAVWCMVGGVVVVVYGGWCSAWRVVWWLWCIVGGVVHGGWCGGCSAYHMSSKTKGAKKIRKVVKKNQKEKVYFKKFEEIKTFKTGLKI